MDNLLKELHLFLREATQATYAGDGKDAESQRNGFRELEYKKGDWEYRDSYTGFFRSWGQEVVWFKNQPFWSQVYGGGMVDAHREDEEFANNTFTFLKKALSAGEKSNAFQPRGLNFFKDDGWNYHRKWSGDITNFSGTEEIRNKGSVVFTHDFFGGLIQSR